jgi:hypothetical protein
MNDISKNATRYAKPKTLPIPKRRPSMRGSTEDEPTGHKLPPLAPQPIEMGEDAEAEAKRNEEMTKLRVDAELASMVAVHLKSSHEAILDWCEGVTESHGEAIALTLRILDGISTRLANERVAAEVKARANADRVNAFSLRPAKLMPPGGGNITPGPSGPHYPSPGGSRYDKHESIPVSINGRPAAPDHETTPNWMREMKDYGRR